jgi:hypothetical protein
MCAAQLYKLSCDQIRLSGIWGWRQVKACEMVEDTRIASKAGIEIHGEKVKGLSCEDNPRYAFQDRTTA